MVSISQRKDNVVQSIFKTKQAIIGVVHCPPLPGTPRHDGESFQSIIDRALYDASAYAAGVDGLIVENHGDIPFLKPDEIGPETAASLAVITDRIGRDVQRSYG